MKKDQKMSQTAANAVATNSVQSEKRNMKNIQGLEETHEQVTDTLTEGTIDQKL